MKTFVRDLLMIVFLLASTTSAGLTSWPCWVDNSKAGVLCTPNQVTRDLKGDRL